MPIIYLINKRNNPKHVSFMTDTADIFAGRWRNHYHIAINETMCIFPLNVFYCMLIVPSTQVKNFYSLSFNEAFNFVYIITCCRKQFQMVFTTENLIFPDLFTCYVLYCRCSDVNGNTLHRFH